MSRVSIAGKKDWTELPAAAGAHPSGGKSKTKQADADAADINKIIKRFYRTGLLDDMVPGEARYGDFTGSLEYYDAMVKVREAQEDFLLAPAELRRYCDNDVGKFLDLVQDPDQLEKLKELGLDPEIDPTLPDPKPDAAPEAPPEPAEPAAAEPGE